MGLFDDPPMMLYPTKKIPMHFYKKRWLKSEMMETHILNGTLHVKNITMTGFFTSGWLYLGNVLRFLQRHEKSCTNFT
jgi:hypothetical protein